MEKAYLDMDALRVTYGPHGVNSHKNSYAIDLGGADTGISKLCAPFSGYVRRIRSNSNELWFESAEPVLWANGTQDYVTIMMIHANSVPVSNGQYVKQGEWLYSEGTKGNASGNHIHFEVGRGKFVSPYGWYSNGYGNDGSEVWNIYNQVDPTSVFFIKASCPILDPGTDNTSGKALVWTVDNGSSIGNMEKNTYFTVSAGNMEYFSNTDVNTNLGYLEKGKSYVAYDSYVGSDFTWWRFRHPDGNLYWTAMIWDRCSAYGDMPVETLENKVIASESEAQLYYTCDPFNPANTVLSANSRTKASSKSSVTLYDKEWCSVVIGGTEYWVPLSNSVTLVDSSWEDVMVTLPSGSTLTILSDSVYTYSEPNPSKSNGSVLKGTVLRATRQSSTGIMGFNWYEAVGEDGSLIYIVVNNSQVLVDKTGSGGSTGGGDGDNDQGGSTTPPAGDTNYDTKLEGMDVSKYQGNINWASVKSDPQGISFVFIRAVSTSSSLYVDPYLITNMKGAEEQGIPYGLYIFTYGEDEAAIDAEIDLCINQLTGYNPTYPIAWDVEADFFKNTANKSHNTDLILYALRRIENYGYMPILYTYYNMIMNYIDYQRILDLGYSIWIADYRGYNGFAQYGESKIWQYTSSGSVNGISGNVDRNISYFDFDRYITDRGLNNGATSKYPSTPMSGYLTVTVSNAEAFPYPSVNAEGNYYLGNGLSYSIIGKCDNEIDGYTWYLIADNGRTYYVPYIGNRMTITEGDFITSQYRFRKTKVKTWVCNYETMELFSEPDIYTQMGYMTKNSPYEVFGILEDPIVIDGYSFIFLIVKTSGGYAYCVDFSKDNKCYLYESEDPYPLDSVPSGSKLVTTNDWIGYWTIPSTYDTTAVAFMEKEKRYTILGKTRYDFDKKSWYAIDVDGTLYYVMNDSNVTVTTDEYNIPYDYSTVENTNLEVCSTTSCYESCDVGSVATVLLTDKVYSVYGKITDSSVNGEWYIILVNDASSSGASARYVLVQDGNCNVYTGDPYPLEDLLEENYIIPNQALTYYDLPTTSSGVSTALGEISAGTILQTTKRVTRKMIGGTFYPVQISSGTVYVSPETSYQCFVGPIDTITVDMEYGIYAQCDTGINGYSIPHIYGSPIVRIPANTRFDWVKSKSNNPGEDGNSWCAVEYQGNYYWVLKDELRFDYSYKLQDMGANFRCITESTPIKVYSHCSEDPSNLIQTIDAPANVSISSMVTEVINGKSWYTIISDFGSGSGTIGYIPVIDDYTFEYVYLYTELGDYAFANVSKEATAYERPDEASEDLDDKVSIGKYPVEIVAEGIDGTTGSWLKLDEKKYVKVSSTVTLEYTYPTNIVSKYLTITVTGESLIAYARADLTSTSTSIPNGSILKPTTTFEANGKNWYGITYNGNTYYIPTDDSSVTITNTYEQVTAIEGFCVTALTSDAVCYEEPSLSAKTKSLEKDRSYTIPTILADAIEEYVWYTLSIDGVTYYIPNDESNTNVRFEYKYDENPVDIGWYLTPLSDNYTLYDNPVQPKAVDTIPTTTSVEILTVLTNKYGGMTWYTVFYTDRILYAPNDAKETMARVYNLEDEETADDLEKLLESLKKEREGLTEVSNSIEEMNTKIQSMKSTVDNLSSGLDVVIGSMDSLISKLTE